MKSNRGRVEAMLEEEGVDAFSQMSARY